ncbi:hypothetical protein GC105_16185 [Alkalibaculum sp. M08DMB]|uniref:Uncharacterized protein n=1 Tax=Alkalibaculum sporogenes TaxID=2655001 RepID=A0A6A7KD73_9FIRM|nr:hypothetical protein [Alkalibaculum sporogenes]MPW27305.1 hypothetical protein [Alkalibaculum sporogenes]
MLLELGYDGSIYMTSVTKDITVVSALSNLKYAVKDKNSVYIESKRDELNQKGFYLYKGVLA